MTLFKKCKIFLLSILIVCSISSLVFAAETSKEAQKAVPIINSIEDSTNTYSAQQQRINDLENRVNELESRISDLQTQLNNTNNRTGLGFVSFLFGAFCALWAQNTRRNAFGWFIAGAFFNVIAVLAVLWHNSNDRNQPPFQVS